MGVWWEALEGLSVSQTLGFTDEEGSGGGKEIVGSRSSSQARSGERFWNSEESLEFGEQSPSKDWSGAVWEYKERMRDWGILKCARQRLGNLWCRR